MLENMDTLMPRGRWMLPAWFGIFWPLLAASVIAAEPGGAPGKEFTFRRGVNISHWLSQNEGTLTYAAPWFGEEDVAWIAAHGFDHIRLPVDVRTCMKDDGTLDDAKLAPVHAAIGWAKARGLGLVLDAHFLPGADFNYVGGDKRVYTDEALMTKVAGVWRELAKRFANEGPEVRFEILNEPVAEKNEELNPFMHRMLAAIRESNPTRVVYVTCNKWSSFSNVVDVVLPDDPHIALTVHFYEPLAFTHQRASWVGFKPTLPPITFPGRVPDLTGHTTESFGGYIHAGDEVTEAQVRESFAKLASWVQAHAPKIEIYLGEFGVYEAAPDESAQRWMTMVVGQCESRGWSWAVWDYNDSFGVRAGKGGGTRILAGLFAKAAK